MAFQDVEENCGWSFFRMDLELIYVVNWEWTLYISEDGVRRAIILRSYEKSSAYFRSYFIGIMTFGDLFKATLKSIIGLMVIIYTLFTFRAYWPF